MSRQVTRGSNGASESVLVPNNAGEYWLAIVTGPSDWSTMTATLQASADNQNWFTATNVSGAVSFDGSNAVLVSSGLYYRLVIANYSDDVTLTIKPN